MNKRYYHLWRGATGVRTVTRTEAAMFLGWARQYGCRVVRTADATQTSYNIFDPDYDGSDFYRPDCLTVFR